MSWYYVLDGASHGPVAEAELRRLQESQTLPLDTPVWTEGMTGWLPFHKSPLATGTSPSGGHLAIQPCAECGRTFAEAEMLRYDNAWICAACKPVYFQRLKEGVAAKGTFAYASVGKRFVALLLDSFILFLGILVLAVPFLIAATWVVGPNHEPLGQNGWLEGLTILGLYLLPPLYEIVFIGKYGATPGKMLLKIKVVRADGGHVSYARSTGRYFAKGLSGLIFYIGFLMAFWDDQKRALHDQICSTVVIEI